MPTFSSNDLAEPVIEGARVDNLDYLKEHKIDKNQVSQELARIFSQMVYLNGFFRKPLSRLCVVVVNQTEWHSRC